MTVVSTTREASKDSPGMALGGAILRSCSVDATKASARALLSPPSALFPTAPMKSHTTHTPVATDARATTLLISRELSTVLDCGSQWAGEKAIAAASL